MSGTIYDSDSKNNSFFAYLSVLVAIISTVEFVEIYRNTEFMGLSIRP